MIQRTNVQTLKWQAVKLICDRDYVVRTLIVLAALVILYARLPRYFSYPQFWAEDALNWQQGRLSSSVFEFLLLPVAGYLVVATKIIAASAMTLPDSLAPTVYIYSSIVLNLAVVWIVTSPRLDIPFRPLAALAVVTSYPGIFALGTLANLQWVFPVGAVAILLMRPSCSKLVTGFEYSFFGLAAITGPYSIFLLGPSFASVYLTTDLRSRGRQIALTAICALGVAAQIICILVNLDDSLLSGPHASATATMAINMPLHQLFAPFGDALFAGRHGVIVTAFLACVIAWLAWLPSNRLKKLSLIFISVALVFAGIIKSGIDLQYSYGLRYFYVPSVLAIWFVLYSSVDVRFQKAIALLICIFEILSIGHSLKSERVKDDFEWSVWSLFIDSGLPVTVPIAPHPWSLTFLSSENGRLAGLNNWIGKPVDSVATIDERPCAGDALNISAFTEITFANVPKTVSYSGPVPRWQITGQTQFKNLQLVVIANSKSQILGFGYAGFKAPVDYTTWIAIVPALPSDRLAVYGVTDIDGRICQMTYVNVPAASK